MLPIVSFVFLISYSGLARSENEAPSVWWDPEISSHSESVDSLRDGPRVCLLSLSTSTILCCVCQKAVKRAKEKLTTKIEKKIHSQCNKLKPKFQGTCRERGKKYGKLILSTLFPGKTPEETCQKISFCKKPEEYIYIDSL